MQDKKRDTRLSGGSTMPPEKTIHFESPIVGNYSAHCVIIRGVVNLNNGVFFFRDCVFTHYSIRAVGAIVRFEGCIFQDNAKKIDYAITFIQCSELTMINCFSHQAEGFLHIDTSPREQHSITNTTIRGLLTSDNNNHSWCTIGQQTEVDIENLVFNSLVNSCSVEPDNDRLYAFFDVRSVRRFSISNVRVHTNDVVANRVFIRALTTSHIYATKVVVSGMRTLLLENGGEIVVTSPTNTNTNTPVGVTVIPPGGGNPVTINAIPTGIASNGVQSAVIVPRSANTTEVIRTWPWPTRVYMTHSDLSFISSSNAIASIIETIGDAEISLQQCNIITNNTNIPILMRDANNTSLNVVGSHFQSIVPNSPPQVSWARLQQIRRVARVEYSMATSYSGLRPLDVIDVGSLAISPAGAIA